MSDDERGGGGVFGDKFEESIYSTNLKAEESVDRIERFLR